MAVEPGRVYPLGTEIHPTAIVDSGAEIGASVVIGPYSIIGPNVKLGDGVKIASHVVVEGHTEVDDETEVSQFATVGAKPQDLKYRDEPSKLTVGKRNKIRECVTISTGTEHGGMLTSIADDNLFMANSHVGHDCRIGSRNVFANSCALAGHVEVGSDVVLGGMVGVHQFTKVGDLSMIGAGAMVANDFPPYGLGQGDRCKLRGLNLIGIKRAGLTEEQVANVKKAYRQLLLSIGNPKEKLAELDDSLKSDKYVAKLIDFIQNSERGLCGRAKSNS